MKLIFESVVRILAIPVTLEGITISLGTVLLFFGIASLLVLLIGGLLR